MLNKNIMNIINHFDSNFDYFKVFNPYYVVTSIQFF